MIFDILLLIVIIAMTVLAYQKDRYHRSIVSVLTAKSALRDTYLDYVLRFYQLHLPDPYVIRPGFREKRCFHCHYPIGENHDADCPWMKLQPLTSTLYKSAAH